MKNIKLTLEYDGKDFFGWQKQKVGRTVQGVLERAIESVTNEKVNTIGCSRTDTGVHAKEFIVNFYTNSAIPGDKIMHVLNNKLPDDVVILNSEEVDELFHARYNSTGKIYCYTILNRRLPTALYRNSSYLFKESLDIGKMSEGAQYFVGTHDFEAFRSLGSSVKSTVRTIHSLEITKHEDFINIYVSGDGFLYNMVRCMVGTLIEVGRGKLNPSQIKDILENKDRKRARKVVPPMGLTLIKVFY